MTDLKQDITKLKTVTNYAKLIGKDRQRVYQMISDKKVKEVVIDGVKFIKVE